MSRGSPVRQMLEMIRFSHTLFALPFALLSAAMAWMMPSREPLSFRWLHLVGLIVAMVGARSAAMAFNRLVDRHIDAANPRTARRHLPAGTLSVGQVMMFIGVSCAVYFGGAALFWPNFLPLALSVPVLGVLLGYSYTKRFTALAHFWLGLALMLAPICAWIAIRGTEVLSDPRDLVPSVILGLAVMFWVAGFDMIYACQDYEFDRQRRLQSIPVRMGVAGALRLAAICHLIMVVLLIALPFSHRMGGPDSGLSWIYGMGIVGLGLLLIYEHRLVRPDDLSRVNQAFFNVNAVISVGLLVVGVLDLFVS